MKNANQQQQCIGNYIIESLIDEGSYCKLFKARHKILQCNVALKVISKNNKGENFHHFDTEVSILTKLKHPFIIELFEVIENEYCKAMVLEYVEKGTLLSHITKIHKIKEDEAKKIYAQILSVLTYLHDEMKIVHCDIKLENILIDRHNNIRLIDFGFADEFINASPQLTQMNGSPSYVAPEIIKGCKYNSAVDIWSSGIILYILLVGHLPFFGDTISSQLNSILILKPEIPHELSPTVQDLILKLLTKDPIERISLSDARNHPWIMTEYESLQQIVVANSKCYEKPDKEIFAIMQECGLSTIGLMSRLLGNTSHCNVEHAYYILRRAKISDIFGGKKIQIAKKSENILLKMPVFQNEIKPYTKDSKSKMRYFKGNQNIFGNQASPMKLLISNTYSIHTPKKSVRRSNFMRSTFEDI